MIQRIRTQKFYPVVLFALLLSLLIFTVAHAAGNIDPNYKNAWGTNIGWLNFNDANSGGVTVDTDHLEGYVWGENIGWIRLNSDDTTGGDPYYANTTASNYGVNHNNSTGELSGYAWGTNVGWINFNPTHGGVTINTSTGDFSGYAWGENIGWIKFSGTAQDATAYKVQTTNPSAITLSDFSVRSSGEMGSRLLVSMLLVMGACVIFYKTRHKNQN